MTNTELEKFKKTLYNEVINEVQGRQGIPITFTGIELEEKTENNFVGSMLCAERSGRHWKVPLLAEIHGKEVVWNANDLGWYSFNFNLE